MNSNLLFNFTVNKDENTIHVQREFAAELDEIAVSLQGTPTPLPPPSEYGRANWISAS